MTDSESQKKAFQFLLEKCNTREKFTRDEFQNATGWGDSSFNTYWSKQFKSLMIPVGSRFRVSLAFRRFSAWQSFQDNVVTQNRKLSRTYNRKIYENVIMFEFFMPLRNEEFLRDALDGLFYKDTLIFRLKALDQGELQKRFPLSDEEPDDAYLSRVCDWLSKRFIGYSISHVNGRYRFGELKTLKQVAHDATNLQPKYLIDETTGVARFIFPVPKIELNKGEAEVEKVAERIRWVFHELFVANILEVVSGEDEVWLLESGMCHQLHIYRSTD